MSFVGRLIPSAVLIKGSASFQLKTGDTIESLVYAGPYEPKTLANVKVAGFELSTPVSGNNFGEIYDGIATYMYHTDDMSNFRDAASTYVVSALIVEVTDESDATHLERVNVSQIVSLSGTFENEDGSKTYGVDLQSGGSASSALSGAADADTISMSDGSVEEELTIDKSVTMTGSNAGSPQNFAQEV